MCVRGVIVRNLGRGIEVEGLLLFNGAVLRYWLKVRLGWMGRGGVWYRNVERG